jgi:hypothetical protein
VPYLFNGGMIRDTFDSLEHAMVGAIEGEH